MRIFPLYRPCFIVPFALQHLVSESRSHFLSSFGPGGPYEGTVALYRRNASSSLIGKFDAELIHALADTSTVRWIAQNGGGYDEIDVHACGQRGNVFTLERNPLLPTKFAFSVQESWCRILRERTRTLPQQPL